MVDVTAARQPVLGGPFNMTVAQLTVQAVLGRRRVWFLAALPLVLLAVATLVRALTGQDDELTAGVAGGLGLVTFVPLLAVIAGTGAIGPEIDDGSIVYLLAKPLRRQTIATTKVVVAIGVVAAFAAAPVLVAALLMSGTDRSIAVALGAAALAAGTAYAAMFLLLAVLTRNAVIVGLLYALIWESLVGSFVPGAKALSVQQWALAITERILGHDVAVELGVDSSVGLGAAVPLLIVVIVGATIYAGRRLRVLRIAGEQ